MPIGVFHGAKQGKKWEKRRLRQLIIIGRFGGEFALVHFRGSYMEVDLEDMRSENRRLQVIDLDGASKLHLPSAKLPIRYIVDSKTLIFLSVNAKWDFEPGQNDAVEYGR